jgi:restriction system protein
MAERVTLFHILSRQPWWVTLLVGGAVFAIARLVHEGIAPFMAIPFVLLAIYIGFQQLRGGPAINVEETLKRIREMSWEEFSTAVAEAYVRDGYSVEPATGGIYDFAMTKNGRVTFLQCRRWKTAQVGAGPIRELAAAVDKNDAYNGISLAANEFSKPARDLAKSEPVILVAGAELAQVVARGQKKNRRWFRR